MGFEEGRLQTDLTYKWVRIEHTFEWAAVLERNSGLMKYVKKYWIKGPTEQLYGL